MVVAWIPGLTCTGWSDDASSGDIDASSPPPASRGTEMIECSRYNRGAGVWKQFRSGDEGTSVWRQFRSGDDGTGVWRQFRNGDEGTGVWKQFSCWAMIENYT